MRISISLSIALCVFIAAFCNPTLDRVDSAQLLIGFLLFVPPPLFLCFSFLGSSSSVRLLRRHSQEIGPAVKSLASQENTKQVHIAEL